MAGCPHCNGGFFDGRFGQDVECVNGVLIDIDEAHEGGPPNTIYPVAPCHPMWGRQLDDPDAESWRDDSIERLEAWRADSPPEYDEPSARQTTDREKVKQ